MAAPQATPTVPALRPEALAELQTSPAIPVREVSPRVLAELRAVARRLDSAIGCFVARKAA